MYHEDCIKFVALTFFSNYINAHLETAKHDGRLSGNCILDGSRAGALVVRVI